MDTGGNTGMIRLSRRKRKRKQLPGRGSGVSRSKTRGDRRRPWPGCSGARARGGPQLPGGGRGAHPLRLGPKRDDSVETHGRGEPQRRLCRLCEQHFRRRRASACGPGRPGGGQGGGGGGGAAGAGRRGRGGGGAGRACAEEGGRRRPEPGQAPAPLRAAPCRERPRVHTPLPGPK
ncbi:myosin heavy chain IB-like [Vulpes lagopus]|uniref:myosin heavy chain IB-like n=1 Tax=Vulpes lagopus TaxID=494514 RepID=UPI001BC9257C|nr:myosin heavy chain IB-like [Vulpes lagopus]